MNNERFKRDYELSLLEDEYNWNTYDIGSGTSYEQAVIDSRAILILNTGAHWPDNMSGYGMMVMRVLGYLQRNLRGKRVFYRASSHGHTGCTDASHPETRHGTVNQTISYNWRLLEHYNYIWDDEITRMKDDRLVYLNIFPMSGARADSHSLSKNKNDCLHYCLPGIVDFWNYLLISFIVHTSV